MKKKTYYEEDFTIDCCASNEWYVVLENEDEIDYYLMPHKAKLAIWDWDTGFFTTYEKAHRALLRFLNPNNIEEQNVL